MVVGVGFMGGLIDEKVVEFLPWMALKRWVPTLFLHGGTVPLNYNFIFICVYTRCTTINL